MLDATVLSVCYATVPASVPKESNKKSSKATGSIKITYGDRAVLSGLSKDVSTSSILL